MGQVIGWIVKLSQPVASHLLTSNYLLFICGTFSLRLQGLLVFLGLCQSLLQKKKIYLLHYSVFIVYEIIIWHSP